MRTIIIAVLACVACTKPNPNVCCVTETQCADLGADELRPCAVGQACAADFTCVAAECSTSIDCTSPDAPICANGLCIGACTGDADCADVTGRTHCSPEGTCVGCLDASQCSADAAICDPDAHACRGCERDDECASGVCIEADGVCADESRLLFVSQNGTDDGLCGSAAPCRTLSHALSLASGDHSVIVISGGTFDMGSETLAISKRLVIDGRRALVQHQGSTGMFLVGGGGDLLVEGLGLDILVEGDVSVGSFGRLRVHDAIMRVANASGLRSTGGELAVTSSRITASSGIRAIQCYGNGSIIVADSSFDAVSVHSDGCMASLSRNKFFNEGLISIGGGGADVVNNLVVAKSEYSDAVIIQPTAGGRFAFNTVVNIANVPVQGVALSCDPSVSVTSNVFAYNSTSPIQGTCIVRNSLFDAAGASAAGDNLVAEGSTFFVDSLLDFHLAPTSPALEHGEPGVVSDDLEGRLRGAAPDIGAFEAP